MLSGSLYFGLFLSLITYWIGLKVKEWLKWTVFHPLLIAIVLVIVFLAVFNIPYESYNQGAQLLSYLLTPATICLALPLYHQVKILKDNWQAVLGGLLAGCAASVVMVAAMCSIMKLESTLSRSLLPKSITTAIAVGVSEEIGGIPAITVAAVIITGILGAIAASAVFRLFRIKDPIAQGLACGASSHAIGTTKALELGEVQGAMSSLAIVVTGSLTVVAAPLAVKILG